jgi:hypothetical protein
MALNKSENLMKIGKSSIIMASEKDKNIESDTKKNKKTCCWFIFLVLHTKSDLIIQDNNSSQFQVKKYNSLTSLKQRTLSNSF